MEGVVNDLSKTGENILQLYKDNDKVLPMAVRKHWWKETSCLIVKKIVIKSEKTFLAYTSDVEPPKGDDKIQDAWRYIWKAAPMDNTITVGMFHCDRCHKMVENEEPWPVGKNCVKHYLTEYSTHDPKLQILRVDKDEFFYISPLNIAYFIEGDNEEWCESCVKDKGREMMREWYKTTVNPPKWATYKERMKRKYDKTVKYMKQDDIDKYNMATILHSVEFFLGCDDSFAITECVASLLDKYSMSKQVITLMEDMVANHLSEKMFPMFHTSRDDDSIYDELEKLLPSIKEEAVGYGVTDDNIYEYLGE